MAIEIGQAAPEFSLKDQDGNVVSLSDFAGKQAVALVFYPFTFTGVCEGELCAIRDDYAEFEAAGVQVLACSCDTRFAQAQWASSRATSSRCCRTSGPTARWPRPTACSTTPSAAPTGPRS